MIRDSPDGTTLGLCNTRKPSWRKGKRATAVRVWRPLAKKSTANHRYAISYWWLILIVAALHTVCEICSGVEVENRHFRPPISFLDRPKTLAVPFIILARHSMFLLLCLPWLPLNKSLGCDRPYSKRHGTFGRSLGHATDYDNFLAKILKPVGRRCDSANSTTTKISYYAYIIKKWLLDHAKKVSTVHQIQYLPRFLEPLPSKCSST